MCRNTELAESRVGNVYNGIEVVKLDGYINRADGRKRQACVARCHCGNEWRVSLSSLAYGGIKSCGCTRKIYDTYASGNMYVLYRNGAKDRNYSFNISYDEFMNLTSQNCHYCGVKPSRTSKFKESTFTYNGIDRMDNARGYEIDNVVPCCTTCNQGKMAMSYDEFINHLDRLVKFRSENKERV